jgi:hypothetical protein
MLINPVAYFDGKGRLPVWVISVTLPAVKCGRRKFEVQVLYIRENRWSLMRGSFVLILRPLFWLIFGADELNYCARGLTPCSSHNYRLLSLSIFRYSSVTICDIELWEKISSLKVEASFKALITVREQIRLWECHMHQTLISLTTKDYGYSIIPT